MRLLRRTVLLFTIVVSPLFSAEKEGEWPYFGGDQGTTKYSFLAQINKDNVKELGIVWQWKASEEPLPQYGTAPGIFEATPLMIGDVLYLSTPYNRVVALDANTGQELWSYDPRAYQWGPGPRGVSFAKHRGIATWTDGKQRRIFLPTRGRLIALDAETSKPIPTFGREGVVSLTEGLPWELKDVSHLSNLSPPVVYKNLVIVGSGISDSLIYK